MRGGRGSLTPATVGTLALVAAALAAPAATGAAGSPAEFALARFLQPTSRPLVTYRALRRLRGMTDGGGMRATMTVWTELGRDGQFRYDVVREEGSGQTRNRVFRGVLETERDAVRTGQCTLGDLTLSNYQFEPSAVDHGLARIAITPRSPHQMRVVGSLFVRPDDGELVRVEGRLSKRPSFWTRRIDVVRRYANLGGTHVPVAIEATAHVLLLGRYDFAMEWEYETVNGERIGSPAVRAARATASAFVP